MPNRPEPFWLANLWDCKHWAGQFEKGYCTCPDAGHDKKAGLKGETSNELTCVNGIHICGLLGTNWLSHYKMSGFTQVFSIVPQDSSPFILNILRPVHTTQ